MGLSLSGVFHSGIVAAGPGPCGLTRRSGLAGSFFTGALAAVVATPCTAPFMGTAVGFALTQPPPCQPCRDLWRSGSAWRCRFLLLTLAPQLIGRLPRPGAWMETLRQLLAFPVYATVAWLVWVLGQQVGPAGQFAALAGLVLVGLAAWSLSMRRNRPADGAGAWRRERSPCRSSALRCRGRRHWSATAASRPAPQSASAAPQRAFHASPPG